MEESKFNKRVKGQHGSQRGTWLILSDEVDFSVEFFFSFHPVSVEGDMESYPVKVTRIT